MPAKKSGAHAAKAAMKQERARDAARAMQEYEAERLAVRAKTARLRALRLARDAEKASPKAEAIGQGKR